jgi:hypothetical protein
MRDTNVMHDAWVGVVVCAWERDTGRKLHGTISCYFDLNAIGIELGTALRVDRVGDVAFVQGDEFSANEVAVVEIRPCFLICKCKLTILLSDLWECAYSCDRSSF